MQSYVMKVDERLTNVVKKYVLLATYKYTAQTKTCFLLFKKFNLEYYIT